MAADPKTVAPYAVDASVVSNDLITHDTRLLRLRLPKNAEFRFRAGQFARLELPGGVSRDYSIASAPPADGSSPAELDFHVRLSASGSGGSRIIHDDVKTGQSLRVSGPFGDSHWRAGHQGPMLLVAGGTGLAPMMAIAEATLASGQAIPVLLYLGARDERDVYGEARLRELAGQFANFRYEIVLSDPSGPTSRRRGMVTDVLAADLGSGDPATSPEGLAGAKVYIAGPPAMVSSTTAWLLAAGVPAGDIHSDAY